MFPRVRSGFGGCALSAPPVDSTVTTRLEYQWRDDLGLYLLPGEELAERMDPVRWTETHADRVTPDRLVACVQDVTHTALNGYLNGMGLGRFRRYGIPVGRRGAVASVRRLRRVLATVPAGRWPGDLPQAQGDAADVIASVYRALESALQLEGENTPSRSVMAGSVYDAATYAGFDSRLLTPVRDLVADLERAPWIWDEFLIHGSFGTLDYAPGFSDLDTLVILSRSVTTDARALRRARGVLYPLQRHFYRIDPLQHHGFFVFSALDQAWYPETYFPLVLFSHARGLRQERPTFRLRPVPLETYAAVWGVVQWLRAYRMRHDRFANLNELKLFVSFVLLLPALYLQAIGEPTYKRESFARLAEVCGREWEVLSQASALRTEYFPCIAGHPFMRWMRRGPPPLVQRVGKTIMRRGLRGPLPGADLLDRGLAFGEALLARLAT